MQSIEQIKAKPKGGKRLGAGRKRVTDEQRELWFNSHGMQAVTAREILAMADERAKWYRVLNSPDDNVVLRSLQFLMAMRDGKPSQQINVTSKSISISATDVASARAIAAELSAAISPIGSPTPAIPKLGMDSTDVDADAINEEGNKEKANIMVSGDQGTERVV